MMGLMFLRLGYLRHPQCRKLISINIPAFLIILLTLGFVAAAECGDGTCYLGYNSVKFELLFNESSEEYILNESEDDDFTVDNKEYLIELVSVNSSSMKVIFKIDDNEIIELAENEHSYLNQTKFTVKDILTNLESEALSCPEDCDECSNATECVDNDRCTFDNCTGIPKECVNIKMSDCVESKFYSLGDAFSVGSGYCKHNLFFKEAQEDNNSITLSISGGDINISYLDSSLNLYGYAVELAITVYGTELTYQLRYDEITNLIYIEQGDAECPSRDSCLTNSDCGDNNPCTIDHCTGQPQRCLNKPILWCKSGDGCCPEKCNDETDEDCINPDECASDSDCDDTNSATLDICSGTPRKCNNTLITDCIVGDNFCPANCNYENDTDCEKPVICGDGSCEKNETKENCCSDCGCDDGYECSDDGCVKGAEILARENLEENEQFKVREEKLLSKGFTLKNKDFIKSDLGFNFKYAYTKNDKESYIEGSIEDDNKVEIKKISNNVLIYVILVIAVLLIGLALMIPLIKKRKKTKSNKEDYYKKLLDERFSKPQMRPRPRYRIRQINFRNTR